MVIYEVLCVYIFETERKENTTGQEDQRTINLSKVTAVYKKEILALYGQKHVKKID